MEKSTQIRPDVLKYFKECRQKYGVYRSDNVGEHEYQVFSTHSTAKEAEKEAERYYEKSTILRKENGKILNEKNQEII